MTDSWRPTVRAVRYQDWRANHLELCRASGGLQILEQRPSSCVNLCESYESRAHSTVQEQRGQCQRKQHVGRSRSRPVPGRPRRCTYRCLVTVERNGNGRNMTGGRWIRTRNCWELLGVIDKPLVLCLLF